MPSIWPYLVLLLLGFFVLNFGNFGYRFEETYSLTVTFDEGGGLI